MQLPGQIEHVLNLVVILAGIAAVVGLFVAAGKDRKVTYVLCVLLLAGAVWYTLATLVPRPWYVALLGLVIEILGAIVLFLLYFGGGSRSRPPPHTQPPLPAPPDIHDGAPPRPTSDFLQVTVRVSAKGHSGARREIKVGLITGDPNGADQKGLLTLPREALVVGAKALSNYVLRNKNSANLQLCIGINATGLTLAAAIAKKCGFGRNRLGVLITGPEKPDFTREFRCALPPPPVVPGAGLGFPGRILVVDDKLKTGGTMREVVKHLKTEYGCSDDNIWYVALLACGIDKDSIARAEALDSAHHLLLENLFLPATNRHVRDHEERLLRMAGDDPNAQPKARERARVLYIPHEVMYFTSGDVDMPDDPFD